jgi:tRNA pseudouridine55 synthase
VSEYSGFLVVDKPSGVTSFSMVSLVRKLTGVRRVGHAGTLDPLASGVLPVAVGQATRLIEYLDDEGKAYAAQVRLGESTATYDAEGAITARSDASGVTRGALESVLRQFVGAIEQRPPLYSAIKVAGKPLYRYARAGEAVAVATRTVRIDSIDLLRFGQGIAELSVHCGKGTYIRSLAHDLGERLGCGAHLAGLVRTRSGGFAIEDAHRPDVLVAAAAEGRLPELLLAPDRAVERRPAAILGATHSKALAAGRDLPLEARGGFERCRAYSVGGAFLGMLGRRENGLWHPDKVFLTPKHPISAEFI